MIRQAFPFTEASWAKTYTPRALTSTLVQPDKKPHPSTISGMLRGFRGLANLPQDPATDRLPPGTAQGVVFGFRALGSTFWWPDMGIIGNFNILPLGAPHLKKKKYVCPKTLFPKTLFQL